MGLLYELLKDVLKYAGEWSFGAIWKNRHIPLIDVNPHLDGLPFPLPNRTDIARVTFTLTNDDTTKTKILEGYVRISNPNKATDEQKTNITKTHFAVGEHKDFFVQFPPPFHQRVMSGEAVLKAECNLTLQRPNGQSHKQSNQYTYNASKKQFEEDHD